MSDRYRHATARPLGYRASRAVRRLIARCLIAIAVLVVAICVLALLGVVAFVAFVRIMEIGS